MVYAKSSYRSPTHGALRSRGQHLWGARGKEDLNAESVGVKTLTYPVALIDFLKNLWMGFCRG